MDVWSLLEGARRSSGERLGVVDVAENGTRRFTYAEVHRRAASLARFLSSRGIRPGDRVSILAWNGAEFLEATFATAAIGAVLVPLNVRLSARELEAIQRASGARILIAEGALHRGGEEILSIGPSYEAALARHARDLAPAEVSEDAPAQLYYTSGTTGAPKGVVLTHLNVCVHAQWAVRELSLAPSDVWGHFAPMFHLADAWATIAITMVGATHAMLARFEAGDALTAIERDRVTITNLVPTMLARMVAHPRARAVDVTSLRLLLSGGAPISPALVREVEDVFRCEYAQTYGMTETSPYLTISLLKEHLKALPSQEQLRYRCKTGRAFGAVELRVVGEDGRDVPADERTVGEIRVRGKTVTPGYFEDLEATRAAFEDGWLKTGDLAVIDAEGYVTIVDRAKDVIKTGGELVYSTEVENALREHPAVLEAAVFGTPDAEWGEVVRAAVVLREDASASADELRASCRELLAGYKVPRSIEFRSDLPRTGSGKVAKRLLRGR